MGNHELRNPHQASHDHVGSTLVGQHRGTSAAPGKTTLTGSYAPTTGMAAQLTRSTMEAATSLAELEAANQRRDSSAALAALAVVERFATHAPVWLAQLPRGKHAELAGQVHAVIARAHDAIAAAPKLSQRASDAARQGDFTQWRAELAHWRETGRSDAVRDPEPDHQSGGHRPVPVLQLGPVVSASEQETKHGAATNGAATNGAATNGAATNGAATNGAATNGAAAEGAATLRSDDAPTHRARHQAHEVAHASLVGHDTKASSHAAVGPQSEPVTFGTALSTLDAIIDITNLYVVVKDGIGYDQSQPSAHRKDVPPQYHALLGEWFQITHGRVKNVEGGVVTTRRRMLSQRIDHAVAATMPLINALTMEGNPDQVASWLEQFYSRVDAFRARANAETVSDHINAKADKALAANESPIDRLEQNMQVKVASARLLTVARQTTSVVQRLVKDNHKIADASLNAFKQHLDGLDVPADFKAQVENAKSLSDVLQHIVVIASSVETIINIADPEQREQMFRKEFGRHWIGGTAELAKQATTIVQGAIAVYKSVGAALLLAKGHTAAATELLSASESTLSKIGVVLSGLNLVHGAILVVYGRSGDRVDGAVEATSGALGLLSKRAPGLARFTGPLATTLAISYPVLKAIGNATIAGLYGMIKIGLNMAFADMKRAALDVHDTAMRLAVALESGDELSGAELQHDLSKQTDALRSNLRELGVKAYIARTQKEGGNSDPGTYRPLRERFKPLWHVPLNTDTELFTAAELFLSTVTFCFADQQQILEEAVADSVENHA